jgi:transposase
MRSRRHRLGPGSPRTCWQPVRVGGNARPNPRAVLNAIFYLLRTGCQWLCYPASSRTVYHYFRAWKDASVLAEVQGRFTSRRACLPCPSVVILDSRSVKTAERGGIRGFDGHKRVKGRKRIVHIEYALCRLWAFNPGKAVVVPLIGLLVTPPTGG